MTVAPSQLPYPETRTEEVVEELAGVRFPDPYRWLEEDSDEVRAWQARQAEVASAYVRDWPDWSPLRALVERYAVERFPTVPRFAGGVWFREQRGQVVVADEPYGDGRALVTIADYKSGDDAPVLTWLAPSPDARVLAIGVCTDGSEHNSVHLIDVASGRELADAPTQQLHDGWVGGAIWLPDSSGFYFLGLVGPPHEFQQRVFFHRLGRPPVAPEDIPWLDAGEYSVIQLSRDGRWAVAANRLMNPIPVAVRDLGDPASGWRPFVTDVEGTVAGHVVADRYVALTDVGAPRGRIVAIPLEAADPNDPSTWTEIVPASDAVLRAVTPVGEHLYVTEFVDTYSSVRIVDGDGGEVGRMPLPARGAIAEWTFPIRTLPERGHPDEFVFAFSTLASSWATYRHRPGDEELELLKAPDVVLDAVIDDHWATSADGTRVPYHTLRPASVPDGPLPTLVYAYGGFNVPLVPQFPHSSMAAFVAAGGIFVHAHLRGGAEFGREWWEGGRMRNKQNCYADLFAVAEDLVASGATTAEQLAVVGGSNGGLLCGVAVTQRPDLWRAAVPRVPVMDLIGGCRDPYIRWATEIEFADVDDPDEVRRLAEFSPYHNIEEGREFPAVFVDAGDTDPRCPPWHARKFAARLQAAQGGEAPILLHVWENVGHGWATEKSIALDQTTEWLAFVMKALGMRCA